MTRKINDLETASEIPSDDELIVPIFLDNTDHVIKKISVSDLAEKILDRVMKGETIHMEYTKNGIKFRKETE